LEETAGGEQGLNDIVDTTSTYPYYYYAVHRVSERLLKYSVVDMFAAYIYFFCEILLVNL